MQRGYALRRILENLATAWVVLSLAFVLFRLLPGDPAAVLLGPLADPIVRAQVAEELGLNQPWPVQYAGYVRQILGGDFGVSFLTRQPVLDMVGPAFMNTFALAVLSAVVSFSLGTVLGVVLARKRGTRFEAVCMTIALFLRSMPPFWVGLLAIMLFAIQLKWLPFVGLRSAETVTENLLSVYLSWDFVVHAILPVGVGSLYFMVMPLLLMRSSVLSVMGEDFTELARAKGLTEWAILFRHVARAAILPVATDAAAFIGWAMGGLVTLEVVFSWPGLGKLLVSAIDWRDYPVAQAALLLICATTLTLNLVADLLYVYLDPRVEMG
ncbi:MAG: ABC transporter permease [Chloroflexi bacterium]|nr:ABC transporter permease [Chloroflexota bacterium]